MVKEELKKKDIMQNITRAVVMISKESLPHYCSQDIYNTVNLFRKIKATFKNPKCK